MKTTITVKFKKWDVKKEKKVYKKLEFLVDGCVGFVRATDMIWGFKELQEMTKNDYAVYSVEINTTL